MNLLTVEVICPSVSRSFDFRIPPKMSTADVKARLIDDIRTFEDNAELFADAKKVGLYCETTGRIPESSDLESAGVKCGDRIMLI